MDSNLDILSSDEVITGVARGLKKGGKLNKNAKDLIITSLSNFKQNFDFTTSNYRAVATEAFRLASDSEEFFAEIYAKTGLKFSIISGEEEAILTRLAIDTRLDRLGLNSSNALSIDIGSGSSELVFKNHAKSFAFGIIRFANEYELNSHNADIVTDEAVKFISDFGFDSIVLTSGVPTTILALKIGMDYATYDPALINGGSLLYSDFDQTRQNLSTMPRQKAELLVGHNRQILIIAGTLLLKSLLKNHQNLPMTVVDDGLREGICIDYFARHS